jgi:hypothetical protein
MPTPRPPGPSIPLGDVFEAFAGIGLALVEYSLRSTGLDPHADLSRLERRYAVARLSSTVLGTIGRHQSLLEGVLTGTAITIGNLSSTSGSLIEFVGGLAVPALARQADGAERARVAAWEELQRGRTARALYDISRCLFAVIVCFARSLTVRGKPGTKV